MNDKLKSNLERLQGEINMALRTRFDTCSDRELSGLLDAQKYSLFLGGKRIRPVLTLAFAELFGGTAEAAMPYAIAVEMIHTASLIHDDLPSIDNDDLRRGAPTNHKVFGEAAAVLAADGLFMDAFAAVAENTLVQDSVRADAALVLARAVGSFGLVGGEYIDVVSEGREISLSTLKKMHAKKTGALIRASVELGALAAGVSLKDPRMADAALYAEAIGLSFQVVDDVLDVTGTTEELGKPIGSDREEGKITFLKFYSPSEALEYASTLTKEAISVISKYEGSEFLAELADFLVKRRS